MQAIGVASKDAFPDNRFSALSGGNTASNGRLNGAGAWSPSNNNDANDYLQIDLLYEFVICAVATQGNPNADHWTTTYKLQLALMDNDWIPYQEDDIIKVGMIRQENNILCETMLTQLYKSLTAEMLTSGLSRPARCCILLKYMYTFIAI